jgi:acetoin utilization protein AcuB
MLVKNWMSKPVVTIDVNSSMQDASHLLKKHHIRMIPVLHHEKLVGIITDRDLKRSSASDATSLDKHELLYLLSKVTAKEIMTKNPICVTPDYTIEETARIPQYIYACVSGQPQQASRTQGGSEQKNLLNIRDGHAD